MTAFALASGTTATWSLDIPADPWFLGVRFRQQAVASSSQAGNPAGALLSNATVGTIG